MSQTTEFADTVRKFLSTSVTASIREQVSKGDWPSSLWDPAAELGLTTIAVSEARGGVDFPLADVASVLFEAGRAAAPMPLGEAVLAELMLAAAGVEAPGSFVAPFLPEPGTLTLERRGDQLLATGVLVGVAWGRHASHVAVVASVDGTDVTVLIPVSTALVKGDDLAGEPRDLIEFSGATVSTGPAAGLSRDAAMLRGAWIKAVMMSGAMDGALEISIRYTKERVQFGKPIAAFQAVQQQMAVFASQSASASAAAAGATDALSLGNHELEVAMAKTRVGEAAGVAAAIAHQVHGAMGFTREYALQHLTRRLWAWRDDYGSEVEWAQHIGSIVARLDGAALWPLLTATEDGH